MRGSLVLAACVLIGLGGCTRSHQRFLDAYTDVLIVRMTERDSAAAQRKVTEALARHGYSEAEFRAEFFERARQPEQLRAVVDSARARAARSVATQK